jgi:hypothetical protein
MEKAITAGFAITGGVALWGYEFWLHTETSYEVLATAWITVSIIRWMSASYPAEIPINTEYANAHPRKFLAFRALRAAVIAVPLFLDVFGTTSDVFLSDITGLPHNTAAEDSARCCGGSVGFLLVLLFKRDMVFNKRTMRAAQIVVALVGGLCLSVGPALAMGAGGLHGRGIAAAVAFARVVWLLAISTQFLSDVVTPHPTTQILRMLFWAAAYSVFVTPTPCMVLSGASLGVATAMFMKLQSPLLALSSLCLVGGTLSLNTAQVGVSLLAVTMLGASRYACRRSTAKFHSLSEDKEPQNGPVL